MKNAVMPDPEARISRGALLIAAAMKAAGKTPLPEESIDQLLADLEGRFPGLIARAGGIAQASEDLRRLYAYSAMADAQDITVTGAADQIAAVARASGVRLVPGEEIGAWCDRVRQARPWLSSLMNEIQLRPEGLDAVLELERRGRREAIAVWARTAGLAVLGAALIMPLNPINSALALWLLVLELRRLQDSKARLKSLARDLVLRQRFGMPLIPGKRRRAKG